MRLRFTKMHGAGNDFVVLDATRAPLELTTAQLRLLGDRRFGVGADQILLVEPPSPEARSDGVDFRYRIFNGASGAEVEHCGNGARCFVRYVREHGLTDRDTVRVETMNSRIELHAQPDGRVTVDMSAPRFDPAQVPFDTEGLVAREVGGMPVWAIDLPDDRRSRRPGGRQVELAVLSMGNPHAVLRVDNVNEAPVAELGPLIEAHPRFARKVNVGFLQVLGRSHVALRVFERDAGETLACGTGACAAVVAGIRLGWLDTRVDVDMRGGRLTIEWDGAVAGGWAPVRMTGPAQTVFEGEIEL